MSVGTLIKALVKHKTGNIQAPEFRMLKIKHLKRGEKLPKDFLNRANRLKAGEKLPKGYGQKPKANTKRQEEIAREKAAKAGSKTMKKDTSGRKVKRAGGGTLAKAFLAGAKALKGNRKSATRLNEAGEKVRAAKEVTGAAKQVGDKIDKKLAKSPQAKKVRKGEGKAAADPKQPSGGSLGKTADMADAGIPKYMIDAYKAKGYDKGLKTKIEELTRAKLARKKATKDKDVKARAKSEMKYGPDFNKTYLLNSIQDMIERGGPGGKSKTNFKRKGIKRKAGGPIIKKRFGSQIMKMMAKKVIGGPGTMPKKPKSKKITPKSIGKKYPKVKAKPVVKKMGGGQVYKYKHGTKSKTIKGRMSGNDVVAGCYD
jgi:hypothetical protein